MRIAFFLLLFSFVSQCTSQKEDEINRWKDRAARVTIIRDEFGVPHIYGKLMPMQFLECCMHSARTTSNE